MIEIKQLTNKDLVAIEEKLKRGEFPPPIEDLDMKDIETKISIDENKQFSGKHEIAKYLYEKIHKSGLLAEENPNSYRVWNFIAITYFRQLLNANKEIKNIKRYLIPESSAYPYMHLIKPSYDVYSLWKDESAIINLLLVGPVSKYRGILLEVSKRNELRKNGNILITLNRLLYDSNESVLKKGYTKILERAIQLFNQYERTYDLYSMPPELIWERIVEKHLAELESNS